MYAVKTTYCTFGIAFVGLYTNIIIDAHKPIKSLKPSVVQSSKFCKETVNNVKDGGLLQLNFNKI